jgi:two-component system KDP operon response regulator KdpE
MKSVDAMQVLVVEDDDHLRIMLRAALGNEHVVTMAAAAKPAFDIASESQLDLVLLDLGLPDMDGTALIPMLRRVTRAPIIVISARGGEAQKIDALDAGADDYLTKPFGMGELHARIRSVMRRTGIAGARDEPVTQYAFGELAIDLEQREVRMRGERVHITPVEFRILAALVRRGGKVITHRQLLREVWGPHHEEDGHYLRIYMRQLRGKLEDDPGMPRYLLNEPAVGYRLASE